MLLPLLAEDRTNHDSRTLAVRYTLWRCSDIEETRLRVNYGGVENFYSIRSGVSPADLAQTSASVPMQVACLQQEAGQQAFSK